MLAEWFVKFFTYSFGTADSPSSFSDGLGEGSFGWRHLLWIAFVIGAAIGGFLVFRRHAKVEKTIVTTLVVLLFCFRFANQTTRAILGVEHPWTEAFPFHMCTVLTFLLPLTLVFDWKAIKTPVYVLAIMGGTVTMLLGDYFDNRFLTVFALEGIAAHSILILVPIWEIAAGRFRLDLRDIWKVGAGILVLMGWAMLANLVFFRDYDPNYMYLMKNELPFGNDENYFLFYVLIFLFFLGVIYSVPLWNFLRGRNRSQG
jgi:uncharacterized membrane protein YwaF